MDVTEYRMIMIQCGLYGTLWANMCKLFPDCKGCPFGDGVDKNVIAEAYGVEESSVMCQMCDWYDSDKRLCRGWEDNIKNENHHCVFYQPESVQLLDFYKEIEWMPAPEPYKEEKSDYEKIIEDINEFMNQAKEKKRKVMSVECGGKTYIFSLADVVEAPDGELRYKWKLLEGDEKEFFEAIYGVSVGDTEVEDSDE